MTSELSASDVAMLSGNNNNGWGGEGGWIWVVIFLIFGMWGRNGWGGNGGDGAPVTEAGLCNAMNFNNLENAVGRLSDAQTTQFTQLTNGICNLGYELQGLNNATNVAIMQGNNDLSAQLAECCCTTQRGIDSVNYNNALNTNTMVSATKDGTQAILDKLCDMENQNLRDQLQAAQTANIVAAAVNGIDRQFCGIENQLQTVVRYPQGMTYTAGPSPFFNQNCCCGNGYINY